MSKSPEHILQKQIVEKLNSSGINILTIGTDVMSALMFLGNPNLPTVKKKRCIFINHHKRMGYTVGQPDLTLLLKDGETLLVEIKCEDGIQSKEQKLFEIFAKDLKHNYVVWRSLKDAEDFIKGYKKL